MITPNEYQASVKRTLKVPDENTLFELKQNSHEFGEFLLALYNLSLEAERLKRAIFYVPESENSVSEETQDHLTGIHAILGIVSEFHELLGLEVTEKGITRLHFDLSRIPEEGGDLDYYVHALFIAGHAESETLKEKNREKLSLRYPERFTSDKALNRDIEAEQQIFSPDTLEIDSEMG